MKSECSPMAKRPAAIKQSELTRYAKAMQAAGIEHWRVEIETDGKINIIASKAADNEANDWDQL